MNKFFASIALMALSMGPAMAQEEPLTVGPTPTVTFPNGFFLEKFTNGAINLFTQPDSDTRILSTIGQDDSTSLVMIGKSVGNTFTETVFNYPVEGNDFIKISFDFIATNTIDGDDFTIDTSVDNAPFSFLKLVQQGSEEWAAKGATNAVNNGWYTVTALYEVQPGDVNFKFRIRQRFNSSAKKLYLDNIELAGVVGTLAPTPTPPLFVAFFDKGELNDVFLESAKAGLGDVSIVADGFGGTANAMLMQGDAAEKTLAVSRGVIDVTGVNAVLVSFWCKSIGTATGDRFTLDTSLDGSSFSFDEVFFNPTDFENGVWTKQSVFIDVSAASEFRIRFRFLPQDASKSLLIDQLIVEEVSI